MKAVVPVASTDLVWSIRLLGDTPQTFRRARARKGCSMAPHSHPSSPTPRCATPRAATLLATRNICSLGGTTGSPFPPMPLDERANGVLPEWILTSLLKSAPQLVSAFCV